MQFIRNIIISLVMFIILVLGFTYINNHIGLKFSRSDVAKLFVDLTYSHDKDLYEFKIKQLKPYKNSKESSYQHNIIDNLSIDAYGSKYSSYYPNIYDLTKYNSNNTGILSYIRDGYGYSIVPKLGITAGIINGFKSVGIVFYTIPRNIIIAKIDKQSFREFIGNTAMDLWESVKLCLSLFFTRGNIFYYITFILSGFMALIFSCIPIVALTKQKENI